MMTPEQTLEMYREMIVGLPSDKIRYIEHVALTEEPLETWSDESRYLLIRMFEYAIVSAENREMGPGDPRRTISVH